MFTDNKIVGSGGSDDQETGGKTMATVSLATLSDYTISCADTLDVYDYSSGSYKVTLDELSNVTIGHSADTDNVTGKLGQILKVLRKNKSVTLSGTAALINTALLGYQIGDLGADSTDATITKTEYIDITSTDADNGYITIAGAPTDGTLIAVVVRSKNNGFVTLASGDTATKDKTYTYASQKVTFASGQIEAGGTVTVKYKATADSAVVMENRSDQYSKDISATLTLQLEDLCNNIYLAEFYFPKLTPNDTFNIEIGDSHATHPFEFTALPDACLRGSNRDLLYRVTIYSDTTTE